MNEDSQPNVSKQDALAALDEVQRVIDLTRKTIAQGCAAPLLILWGCIWAIGYGGSEFSPAAAPQIWLVLGIVGGLASWGLGWRYRSPTRGPNDRRIGLFWLILFVFAAIWMWLLGLSQLPHGGEGSPGGIAAARKFGAYWATIPMFAYMVGGLWLGRFFIWLGAIVTGLTLLGYFFLGTHFSIWMAVTGGGALVLSGIFIRRFWR